MAITEHRVCQNCNGSFIIDASDFVFYEKIAVPAPTFCSPCRNQRRMAWRENRTLYRGVCDLCQKSIITTHAPEGPFTVYCRECYRSDRWDPMHYGRDYDFNQSFFTQYRRLMEVVPRPALTGESLVNSDFTHACQSVKNCFYVFWSYFSEDSENCYAVLLSKNAYDCYVVDNSDHAYESLHSNRLYKIKFGYFLDECLDSSFLYDCIGCSDCFGCVNLRKKKYCFFNEQLSKDEYCARIKEWDLGGYERLQEAKKKFRQLYLSTPHRFAHVLRSKNVTGDIIRDTSNCQTCFSTLDGVQDCKYVYFGGLNLKDSQDVSFGGDTSELLYEDFGIFGSASRCLFCVGGGNSVNVWYSNWAASSSDVFGCVSVKNKQYCILNKQYSKEDYANLVSKIKKHMDDMPFVDKRGRMYKFGEFFPTELSAYAYNESVAFHWYPKTKDEVISEGWRWQDPVARSYKITMQPEQIPDHVRDVRDPILEEIIGCAHAENCNEQCTSAFRISANELAFYRVMNIALPRLCPNCRYAERLQWRNGFQLYHRNCMCSRVGHFHVGSSCTNTFETTFSPEKSEIIYCDQCYKAEFL